MSVNFLILGGPQTGKTTLAKEIFSTYKRGGVIDMQGNWDEIPLIGKGENKFRLLPDSNLEGGLDVEDLENFVPKLKNCCFVFEESYNLFENLFPKWLNKHCVINKAYNGLRSVFIYHAFKDVNSSLLIKADYIFLLKTGEADRAFCKEKAKHLLPYFDKVNEMPQYSSLLIRNTDLAKTNLK